MTTMELTMELRQIVGKKVKMLRAQGIVPAVLYGYQMETQHLQTDAKSLERVLSASKGHRLVTLNITGQPPVKVLAREIRRDILKHHCTHVDFQAVKDDRKVRVHVPVELVGNSPAVGSGGVLTKGIPSVHIECLPGDLPETLKIDLGQLVNFKDSVLVRNLNLSDAYRLLSDGDSMIIKVEPPRKRS